MTTGTLKWKSAIINNSDFRRRIFNVMIASGVLLALCYVLLLANMVWNIIARKSIETEIRALSTNVNSLELQYLAESNKVDLNLAHSLGFKETNLKGFSSRRSLGSLELSQNEL
jgi:hypothetical protein